MDLLIPALKLAFSLTLLFGFEDTYSNTVTLPSYLEHPSSVEVSWLPSPLAPDYAAVQRTTRKQPGLALPELSVGWRLAIATLLNPQIYSDEPSRRVLDLLNKSKELQQIEAEWERLWFADQPPKPKK